MLQPCLSPIHRPETSPCFAIFASQRLFAHHSRTLSTFQKPGLFANNFWSAPARALRQIGTAYVEFFRNIPLLVQIFFLFFALPSIKITIPAFW